MDLPTDNLASSLPPGRLADRPRPAPQLFRFGLRQLLLAVTFATLLVALMATLQGAWPWVIGGVVAMVGAHMFGALVGHRLRDTSREVQQWRASLGEQDAVPPSAAATARCNAELPQATSLAERREVPRRDRWAIVAGAVSGAVLGGGAIAVAWGGRVSIPANLIGALSCGVLGAWLALVATSFTAIARQAMRHAHHEHRRDQDRRRQAHQRQRS